MRRLSTDRKTLVRYGTNGWHFNDCCVLCGVHRLAEQAIAGFKSVSWKYLGVGQLTVSYDNKPMQLLL